MTGGIKSHVRYSWLGKDLEKLQKKWNKIGLQTTLYIDPIKKSESCLIVYSPRFPTSFAELYPYEGVLWLPKEEKLTPEELNAVKEFTRDYKHEMDVTGFGILAGIAGLGTIGLTYLLYHFSTL